MIGMTMGHQVSYVISRLYFILRSAKLVRIILIKLKCSQFTPMHVPAQVLNQLHHLTKKLALNRFWGNTHYYMGLQVA